MFFYDFSDYTEMKKKIKKENKKISRIKGRRLKIV